MLKLFKDPILPFPFFTIRYLTIKMLVNPFYRCSLSSKFFSKHLKSIIFFTKEVDIHSKDVAQHTMHFLT